MSSIQCFDLAQQVHTQQGARAQVHTQQGAPAEQEPFAPN